MGASPRESLGSVGALINTMRQIGMSVGIAFAGMFLTIRQVYHSGKLAAGDIEPAMLSRLSLIGGFQDTILMAMFGGIIALIALSIGSIREKNLMSPAR
jgi:hypothetical protein